MKTLENPIGTDGAQDQFRMARVQLFNWGTFSNVFDLRIAPDGYLFVGPSGSGKSTILDAHAALLTPQKWLDFNVAAREAERHGRDRNFITYVRGAWAQQTGDSGEYVSQYLRQGTAWSAISETYRNGQGRVIVLGLVMWVKGNSTAPADVKRLYLVVEREFDVQELEDFAKSDFDVRRLKHSLPGSFVHQEFSAYQERFRRLLGIESERALRLLHKTQSAKNLGDLNIFMRDFMLDPPATFGIAERLVAEFGELNAAHQAVVASRNQIGVLKPARDEHLALQKCEVDRNGLLALQTAVEPYREHRRRLLLESKIDALKVEMDASGQKVQSLKGAVEREWENLQGLERQNAGMGADVLDRIQKEVKEMEEQKAERIRKRDVAAGACAALNWAMPDEVVWFVKMVAEARQRVDKSQELRADMEKRKDALKEEKSREERAFLETVAEVNAMERQRSNLPDKLLKLRHQMAMDLGVDEGKFPFVGELLEVKPEEVAWQGAIERVLGGFARSILVEDKQFAAVSAYLNERHIGDRLVYHRVVSQVPANRTPAAGSLIRKLNFAKGALGEWLKEDLKSRYDYECVDSLSDFRSAVRAVTRQGQVKHSTTRHEKNDIYRIDDRSNWVIGFDNKEKLALFKGKAHGIANRIAELRGELKGVDEEEALQYQQVLHCQALSNLTWSDVDVASLLTRVAALTKQLETERSARPDLALLDKRIASQVKAHRAAQERVNSEEAEVLRIGREAAEHEKNLEKLVRLFPASDRTPAYKDELDFRCTDVGREITLTSLDQVVGAAEKALGAELRALEGRMSDLRNSIANRFGAFNRAFPAESEGLDATIQSAEDYFGKLQRLEKDDLPRFEQKFLSLLREQSDQNLTLLSTKLDQERAEIKARIELVNESLRTAPFNPGTHLVIETTDRSLDELRQFRVALKDALSHSLSSEPALAEERFVVLASLVKRLGSQETADKNWRALVLDVRQHVEFVARELDGDGLEVEVYRSGSGKSGGQRQKLAATCLAAALRYQLGGPDRSLPSFSTVVLDEAFDKADSEFTAMAMNIFKTFGFQMVVATPLKSVMTLEPFIGGACFVHIKDRKKSAVIPIDYDQDSRRLKLMRQIRDEEETTAS